MSSCSNAQSAEVGCLSNRDALPDIANLAECSQNPMESQEDEGEDEDVDFNPSLKETPSPEASSSLSSEIEGLDADVDSKGNTFSSMGINLSKLIGEVQGSAVGDSEHGEEEIVMQTTVSSGRTCGKELEKNVPGKLKKRKSVLVSQPEIGIIQEKDSVSSSGVDVVNDVVAGELSNTTHSRNPITDFDDEDAICMRTRARYSLASFTLDELETFLQETDDDEDLQNVDDEEEYRKFLAAVLQGGDSDGQTNQETENVDDEDEDNDADFEIEIEEALESDLDEKTREKTQKDEYEGAGRRPETRQNRRQKASAKNKKKFLQQANRPLRPLLPIMPNAPIASFHTLDGRCSMPETPPHCLSSSAEDGFVNGFTPHQIGQLYCLIHEHVQLLIQVFSLCVLEPSRQQTASQVEGLISEMLHKHDQILAWRSVPYPGFCFHPPYIHPSVPNELPKFFPAQCIFESSPTPDGQGDCSSSKMPPPYNISPSKGRYEYVSNGQMGSFQTNDGIFWLPFIRGPILSILDVAPLNLAGRYIDDVKIAVQEYRRRHVEATCDTRFERESLFPFPSFSSFSEASGEALRGTIPLAADMVPSSSPSHQPPKKTLAAALVESSKKQSVALVPKEIVKLAQRFFPLFNSALFPHKPPPVAVARRVLFTDAEDELLAMGLLEYNTDWKAIQQRFLPCKSKHQIFVRQKNRCSSKAPENPIKAVRRMKTSPLTADEQARIQEGLRVFKFDWMSIWKFVVPHRDPSLLPRQWRIALGTQKSYKIDAAKKEKRRLYESKRRKSKAADFSSWQTVSEKEDYQPENAGGEISGDDSIDNEDEVYVHEAFLADWRPGTSSLGSSEPHCSNLGENNLPSDILSQEGTQVMEQLNNYGSGETLPQKNNMKEFTAALRNSQHPYTLSHLTHVRHGASNIMEPNHSVPDLTLKSSKSPFYLRPYRVRRTNSAHLVKLAPDLPPVNLPPSVRVISQSAFKSYQCGASAKVSVSGGGNVGAGIENAVPKLPHVAKLGTVYSMKGGQNKSNSLKHDITNSRLEESRVHKDKCVTEERGSESDLQMHPLLFQATEDGHLPYYPLNCSTSTSSSFSFFSGNQPQVNLSLFRNPHHSNPSVNCSYKSSKSKETTSTSCGIDFHPLLQRTDDVNSNLATACSTPHLPVHLDSFRGKFSQLQSSFDAVQAESQVNSDPLATTTKPSSPNEKANELDLEIHLSSTSRKKKALGSRDLMEHNPMRSTISAMGSRTTMGTQNTNNMYYQHFETCPTVSSKLVSDAPASAIPSNNINRYSLDSVGDQSLPEIVMEQEELSDSDEEIGERVEFECEEMADSEGEEGSDSEQIADVQNKEAPNFVMEKVLTDADCDDQQCDLRTQGDCQGNVCNPGKGSTLSLKLGLTGQGKDNTSTSSWLSLDSRAQDCPPCAKPKRVEGTHGEGHATKKWASCRPNRSCKKKKPSPKRVTAQKHARDTPQQLNLGSLAVTPLRKLRKRGCKTNLNLNTEMTVESSSCLSNDKFS